MRISDWSSDVCSSDLRIAARDIAEKGILGHRDQLERVASAQAQRVDRGAPGEAMEAILQPLGERESLLAPQPDQPLAFLDTVGGGKIGRASCREGGCPEV